MSLALAGYNISTHESIYPLANHLLPGLLQERLSKAQLLLLTQPELWRKLGSKECPQVWKTNIDITKVTGQAMNVEGIPERVSRVKGGTGFFCIEDKSHQRNGHGKKGEDGQEWILLPAEFLLSVLDLGVQVGLEMYIGGSIVIDCSKSYEIT